MTRARPWAAALAAALTAFTTATATVAAQAILPYNPTTAFLSPTDPDVVYILQPHIGTEKGTMGGLGLARLNISERITGEDVEALGVGDDTGLPANIGGHEAYAPFLMPDGSVGVYAGDCDPAGSDDPDQVSSLWIYAPFSESGQGAAWTQLATSISPSKELAASGIKWDPSYLSSTFYFSPSVPSDAKTGAIYTFGGMCPWRGSSGQNKANYTNTMLKLSPNPKDNLFDITLAGTTSIKPVPEAGSTITGLNPVVSKSSTGQVSQAQAFVLIGGHTQGAFIGMSQVAVFSLPVEGWGFQAVEATSDFNITEAVALDVASPGGEEEGKGLAVGKRDGGGKTVPDSRSGHTAVLSGDGSKIIIFGGWVGDLETRAEPQLAVLHVGSGYGGQGQWRWELPTTNGTGLGDGEGIFGHGAVMLPGDILMIIGGYRISSSSSPTTTINTKRQDSDGGSGLEPIFLNTTSMSFISTYINPSHATPQSSNPQAPGYTGDSNSSAHSTNKRVGIGAGVAVGLLAILGAVALYFWYRRKLNRRHTAREQDLAQLSQSVPWGPTNDGEMRQRIGSGSLGYGARNGSGDGSGDGYGDLGYAAQGANYGPIGYQGYDHGHGLVDDGEVSYTQSVKRNSFAIPRKPPPGVNNRNGRGFYQPAPPSGVSGNGNGYGFDGNGHSRANSLGTAGKIHPIYEMDEDEYGDITDGRLGGVGGESTTTPGEATEADPFDDQHQTQSQRNSATSLGQGVEPAARSPIREAGGNGNPRLNLSPSYEKFSKQREVQEWVSDWAAADAFAIGRSASTIHHHHQYQHQHQHQQGVNRNPSLLQAHGRLSPGKSETTVSYSGRTESNLSDQSAVTLSRNDSTSTRTKSLTAFFQGGNGWGLFGGGGGGGGAAGGGYGGAPNIPHHSPSARHPEMGNNAHLGPPSGRITAESFYPSGSGSISPGESERSHALTLTTTGAGHLKPPKSSGSNSAHSHSTGNSSGNGSHSGHSYMTAHSHLSAGFSGLKEQAEGLLPRPRGGYAGGYASAGGDRDGDGRGSPSKFKGRKGSTGWLGSIKKLVGREEWVGSPGTEEGEDGGRGRGVGAGEYGKYDINTYAYADSPSPTRIDFGGGDIYSGDGFGAPFPTRTASAGASLWRRKQGRGDWEDDVVGDSVAGYGYGQLGSGGTGNGVQRSFTTAAVGGMGRDERAEEEDWDVEKAVQGRQVQVMFTVPKERLRVVNHDVSEDESDVGVGRGSSKRSNGSGGSARGRRSPIRDLLTGSPQRSPTRESVRREPDLELGDMGGTEASRKGKETLRDVPSLHPIQPIRHLPPPLDDPSAPPSPTSDTQMEPQPLKVVKNKRSEEDRPSSPYRTLQMERTGSPALSEASTGNRPLSPSKSMRSIKSGRVQDLVMKMEKK